MGVDAGANGGITESKETILSKEPWRLAGGVERTVYVKWAEQQNADRQLHGADQYGDVFQGNPTDQGIEECLDQLFYLYWAKRHIAFLEGQRNQFRALLEEFIEWASDDIGELKRRVFMALQASS